jgi:hypothetical protein
MGKVRYEIWRDSESHRLWGLELFDHEIIGCIGPLRDDDASPPPLADGADMGFERNADLLRWISRKRRQSLHSDSAFDTLGAEPRMRPS